MDNLYLGIVILYVQEDIFIGRVGSIRLGSKVTLYIRLVVFLIVHDVLNDVLEKTWQGMVTWHMDVLNNNIVVCIHIDFLRHKDISIFVVTVLCVYILNKVQGNVDCYWLMVIVYMVVVAVYVIWILEEIRTEMRSIGTFGEVVDGNNSTVKVYVILILTEGYVAYLWPFYFVIL